MERPRKPFSRVLLATDFSECALDAVARAALLPLAPEAQLTLFHVTSPDVPDRWRKQVEADAKRSLDEGASTALARMRASGRNDIAVSTGLGCGQPFVEIIRRSRVLDADLVVLGRHGRRPVRDLFLGSTAALVVRMGDVPALIVNPTPTDRYRRPVLATDLTDTSLRLIDLILQAIEVDLSVAVVSAYDITLAGFMPPESADELSDYHRRRRDEAARQLEKFLALRRDRTVGWVPVLRRGDPREVILEEVTQRRADLVVIGTHGRAGVGHALLGSVAEFVLERARCDVLVGRPAHFSFELP